MNKITLGICICVIVLASSINPYIKKSVINTKQDIKIPFELFYIFVSFLSTTIISYVLFFYKKDCPYCEEMKKNTLTDMDVINTINSNFFAVKIDSRTKDTIYYNNKVYSNQQPVDHGYTWRHDFYAEVASFTHPSSDSPQSTTPTIVLFDNKFEKIITFPGKQPKELLLRRLKN